jgi:hypothetical protein
MRGELLLAIWVITLAIIGMLIAATFYSLSL